MAVNSEVSDGILPKFKAIQAFMVDLVTCKNEEDPLEMKALEWSQRFSHYKSMGIFPNAQGQLTHKSFVRYCPISNPVKILWLSSLPARIKKNQSKMKELEWSQGFPVITLWELSVASETRVLIRSGPKPNGVNLLPK